MPVNYRDLLDKIIRALRERNPFDLSSDRRRLRVDIDAIAAHLATLQVENPLGASERSAHSATIHFTPDFEQRFPRQIRQIRDGLQQHLKAIVGEEISLQNFAASLTTDLRQFRGFAGESGLKYDFDKPYSGLQKQRITLSGSSPSNSLLKFHKLTVTVRNTAQFAEQLQQSLTNYIDEKAETESDREDLRYNLSGMIVDPLSDFHLLLRIVNRETLGKLKKEAKIRYLEYLLENSSIGSAPNANSIYLEDLIRRLRLIEEYINDPSKDEGYYTVNYAGVSLNYRDLFSRAEALDALPVIPIVEGYLGETADQNNCDRHYIFGLKLKLNKPVHARGGKPVFDYYINILDPDSEEHQAAISDRDKSQAFAIKVLKIAFLYYFVFASPWNPEAEDYHPASELDYNPVGSFDERVLPWLRGASDDAKKNLFRSLKNSFAKLNVRIKIDRLKHLLENWLKRQTHLPTGHYPVHIGVRRGILESDINNLLLGHFFNGVVGRNPKECLQYISVGEPRVDDRFLCQMSARITIEDLRYFPAEEQQDFSMAYNIKGLKALPVLWVPETCMNTYKNNFMRQHKLLLFCYDNRRLDSSGLQGLQGFVYRFTFCLLAYICLKLLFDGAEKNLFIPMVRLHEGTHDNPSPSEEFVAAIAKVLSHLFSENYKSNSQGFRIQNQNSPHSIRNGLSSLYSVLPKQFDCAAASLSPEVDKLAMIVVSSRESDARIGSLNRDSRLSNLLGEIVILRQLEGGSIQIEPLKTFSENYRRSHLYSNPPILQDVASELYHQGYRHFLYVAQAPYSSTLHVTQGEEDEELFFMSPEVIKSLKGTRSDMKIYPVFFDKYYVLVRDEKSTGSRYIQDSRELTNLVDDSSRKVVVFFNLFNGLKVGNDRFYRGVISYSTLLNMYPADILDNGDIWQGLISETPLKNTLLHYLTLFHFSRYEARQYINFKLDPYEKIIGDESIGALSLFYHARGTANFNSLAFLTEVRNVLNAEPIGTEE